MTRLLLTTDAVGGVWTYALDLAAALRPLGIEAVVAVIGPSPDAAQSAAAASAGVRLVDTGLELDWLAADAAAVQRTGAALLRLARAERVDLVQLNQPALAAGMAGVPLVVVVHSCVGTWWDAVREGPLPHDLAWQAALTARGLAAADAVVAPSAAFARAVAARYGVMPRVVHNGRAAAAPTPRPMADAVLTAGRLWDTGKDVATLDRAAARIAVPLIAAGPLAGPNGEAFTPTHLHALGCIGEAALRARLAARPVFASAARYEPFGLAVLEAAQAGCALVLADTPGFRELWDGAASFVACGDEAGFAAAIMGLIGDETERLAAGERARARAARFTVTVMAAGMAGIYRDVLADAARAAA